MKSDSLNIYKQDSLRHEIELSNSPNIELRMDSLNPVYPYEDFLSKLQNDDFLNNVDGYFTVKNISNYPLTNVTFSINYLSRDFEKRTIDESLYHPPASLSQPAEEYDIELLTPQDSFQAFFIIGDRFWHNFDKSIVSKEASFIVKGVHSSKTFTVTIPIHIQLNRAIRQPKFRKGLPIKKLF